MTSSYNGWSASKDLARRDLVVAGVAFVPGIRDHDDVATVLGYVAEQWHRRVSPLVPGWCWGFNFRPSTGDPTELSCHASGTAIDINAPDHPFGVPTSRNLTPAQIAQVRAIVTEAGAVVWGGEWNTPDAMHFEIHGDAADVAAAAARIRTHLEDDMFSDEDRALLRETKAAAERAAAQAERARKGSYQRDRELIRLARETSDDVDALIDRANGKKG